MTAAVWGDVVRRRIVRLTDARLNAPLRERCLQSVVAADCDSDIMLPQIDSRRHRLQLACVISALGDKTDIGAGSAAEQMVATYDLDRLLLMRARRAAGCRRALWLLRLSRLNPRSSVAAGAARMMRSRNRHVRFCAMMCVLAAEPLRAHRVLASCGDRLTHFELAQIVGLIFRGRMPVACVPLLNSPHSNLRMLGIAVVRRIGASETAPVLMKIAARDPDRAVAREAFRAICALHLPTGSREAVQALSRMSAADRKSLYRLMAVEGYSVRALSSLFREQERQYFESLVGSYKSVLA